MRESKTEEIIVAPWMRRFQVWSIVLFAPMSLYMSGAIVILLFVLAAACLGDKQSRVACFNRDQPGYHHGLLLLLLVFSFLSVCWARDPGEAFYDWWRMTLLISSGWLLSGYLAHLPTQHCRLLLQAALLGVVLLVLLLVMEWLSGGAAAAWIKHQNTASLLFTSRASAVLVVIIWPIALFCYRRLGGVAAGVLIVVTLMLLSVLPLFAAVVAAVMAGLVFVGYLLWPRLTPAVVGSGLVLAVLLAPLLAANVSRYARPGALQPMMQTLPSSWAHRLVIWDFFSARVNNSPWLGHGLGTAHGLGNVPSTLAAYKRLAEPLGNDGITASMPLHPHNAALQLWHDLGVVGVFGVLAWFWLSVRTVLKAKLPAATAAACLASLTAWVSISGLSFGLWQKWWLACTGIFAALCLLLIKGMISQKDKRDA